MCGRAILQLPPLASTGQGRVQARRRAPDIAKREGRGQGGRRDAERLIKAAVTCLSFGLAARPKVRLSEGNGGPIV